jgi:hypothetical protein
VCSAPPPAVMPLNTVPSPLELSSYEGINEKFVIFYSGRDESGRMWCPVRLSRLAESLPRRPTGGQREARDTVMGRA